MNRNILTDMTKAMIFVAVIVCTFSPEYVFAAEIFSEDFENMPLQPNVMENIVNRDPAEITTQAWAGEDAAPPYWWIVDDICSIGDPDIGMLEWEGWAFVTGEFWLKADGQHRGEFVNSLINSDGLGVGVIAVVDPDEWDDYGSPGDLCSFWSDLNTPVIPLTNLNLADITVTFDSSWRPEDSQKAALVAVFEDGTTTFLDYWESDSISPFFYEDIIHENETISYTLGDYTADDHPIYPGYTSEMESGLGHAKIPAGAKYMYLSFRMMDATNDWWWAIDNISIDAINANIVDEKFDIDVTDVSITEGGSAVTVTVTILEEPSSPVTMNLETSLVEDITLSVPSLQFTSVNESKTFDIEAVNDVFFENPESGVVSFVTDSSDTTYASGYITNNVYVTVNSEDAGIYIEETNGNTVVRESDPLQIDSYDIVLGQGQLTANQVTVQIQSPDPNELTLSVDGSLLTPDMVEGIQTYSVTFTSADSDRKTVELVAVDDDKTEGYPYIRKLNHYLDLDATTEPVYTGSYPGDGFIQKLVVRVLDNDCGSWGYKDADLNHDCKVDLKDFALMAQDWTECTEPNIEGCQRN